MNNVELGLWNGSSPLKHAIPFYTKRYYKNWHIKFFNHKKNDPLNFNIEVFNHKEWIFLSRTIRNKLEKLEKLVPKNIQKPEKYK